MNSIDLILRHIDDKIATAQSQLNDYPSESMKVILCTILSCYRGMRRYVEGLPKDTGEINVDAILHGWVSRSEKDNQTWLHYCEGKPELIGKEWFGNEYDTPIDNKLFPELDTSVPKEVDIMLKIK